MIIFVNGKRRESAASTVSDLWLLEARELDVESTNGFAIARNGIVVRKDRWGDTKLADGDRVEIVRVMQGG